MKTHKTLQDLFSFPGFRAQRKLKGKFGDPKVRIVVLQRRKKQQNVLFATVVTGPITIARRANRETWIQQIIAFMCSMKDVVYFAVIAKACVWSA